jgi:hypothetical protein
MVMVPLRGIGAGGIAPDQQPYDLELTQFGSGNNVQMFSGRMGKSLGYVQAVPLQFQPTHVAPWLLNGTSALIIGSNNALHKYDGAAVTDVSKAGGYSNSPAWQTNQIGFGFVANNGSEAPQYLAPNGLTFVDLPNWPAAIRTRSLRPFQSFLVMIGYTDGSDEYPYTVRWGDEYDPTSVPGSYDITSTTNLAGENPLGGRFGALVDALPLGGTNIIYAERGAYAMQFVGAPLVFAFRELFDDGGLANVGACCTFENRHFVVGREDIYVHDGSSKQSIVSRRVKSAFFSAVADTRSITVTPDYERSEIWVCFADKDAPDSRTANRAFVWNWTNDAWTARDVPGTRALAFGPNLGEGGGASGAWESLGNSWDNWSAQWNDIGADVQAQSGRLFAASFTDSKLYALNESFGANGAGYRAFAEATKIDLDQVLQRATERVLNIKRIVPQISGNGTVTFYIGSSNSPQAPVLWKNTKVFNIESDYKIDCRVSGRYLAIRVESTQPSGQWQLSGFDLDIEEVSER